MLLRCLTTILIFAAILWPTALQAQVSHTASLILFATIAQTTTTPKFSNPINSLTDQAILVLSPHGYTQLTTRDQHAVLLASYVVD